MVNIREEKHEDIPYIRKINEKAFGQPLEADIIDDLRHSCPDHISLVAEDDGILTGHIFFTPVKLDTYGRKIEGMGLAPMAVLPDRQGHGTGSELVRNGIDLIREKGYPFITVLGHPGYYARFRFETASKYGLSCQWEGVPEEAFMVLILDWVAMEGAHGTVIYCDEFNDAV